MPALIPFIGQCAHAKTAWKSANGMAVRITSSQTGCIAQRSRPGWKGRARTACGGASATISRTSASGRPGPHRRGPATRRPGRPSGKRGDGRRCGAGEQRRKHALQLGRQLGVAVVLDGHGRHHRAARSLRQAVQSMPSPRAPRRPDSAPTRSAGRVARARGPGRVFRHALARAGQQVEQRRLAGVGVSDQRDAGQGVQRGAHAGPRFGSAPGSIRTQRA